MMSDGYSTTADLSSLEAVHSVKPLDRESKRQRGKKSKKLAKRKRDSVKISAMSSSENNENFSSNIVVNQLEDEKSLDKKGKKIDIVIG